MQRIKANQMETSENFYQLPKYFFQIEKRDKKTGEIKQCKSQYVDMRLDSKVAYGILKERLKLSLLNDWIDTEGNVFLIATRKEMCKLLNCNKDTFIKIKNELNSFDLLDEAKSNGRATKYYLGNIIHETQLNLLNEGEIEDFNDTSKEKTCLKIRPVENLDPSKFQTSGVENLDPSNKELVKDDDDEINKANSKKCLPKINEIENPVSHSWDNFSDGKNADKINQENQVAMSDVYNTYEESFGTLSPMVAEALDSFVAQSGFDLTNEAIHRTCHERENKTIINCVAYIGSILRNWRNQNFRSLKDIELYDPYLFAEGTVKEFDFVIPIHGPWD